MSEWEQSSTYTPLKLSDRRCAQSIEQRSATKYFNARETTNPSEYPHIEVCKSIKGIRCIVFIKLHSINLYFIYLLTQRHNDIISGVSVIFLISELLSVLTYLYINSIKPKYTQDTAQRYNTIKLHCHLTHIKVNMCQYLCNYCPNFGCH